MRRAKVLSDQEIKRVLAVAANSGQWSARKENERFDEKRSKILSKS